MFAKIARLIEKPLKVEYNEGDINVFTDQGLFFSFSTEYIMKNKAEFEDLAYKIQTVIQSEEQSEEN